jgi:hypothetical protein
MRAFFHPVQLPGSRAGGRAAKIERLALSALAAPFLAILLLCWSVALREAAAAEPTTPDGKHESGAARSSPTEPPATIDGFREAHFGMTQEEVRQAIKKDFPTTTAKLKTATHPSEKTTVLSITVPDLLPHAGNAQVSYVIGYKSKKLIQVNLLWTSENTKESDEAVVGAANSLRDYFAAQNYKPDSVVLNRQLTENGMLVFRGSDLQGRMVVVVLNGSGAVARKDEKTPRPPPLTLEVAYIADPAHPDVFKIMKGQF